MMNPMMKISITSMMKISITSNAKRRTARRGPSDATQGAGTPIPHRRTLRQCPAFFVRRNSTGLGQGCER